MVWYGWGIRPVPTTHSSKLQPLRLNTHEHNAKLRPMQLQPKSNTNAQQFLKLHLMLSLQLSLTCSSSSFCMTPAMSCCRPRGPVKARSAVRCCLPRKALRGCTAACTSAKTPSTSGMPAVL